MSKPFHNSFLLVSFTRALENIIRTILLKIFPLKLFNPIFIGFFNLKNTPYYATTPPNEIPLNNS